MKTIEQKAKAAAYMREYKKKNSAYRKYKLEYDRKYYQTHKEEHCKHSKLYRERHPDKRKAHHKISNGIRDGKIEKSTICSDCGSKEKIEAHHPNYDNPLEVNWLCMNCHKKLHKGETNEHCRF